jgi:hypothetical protein
MQLSAQSIILGERWDYVVQSNPRLSITVNLATIAPKGSASGIWIFGYGGDSSNPNRQALYYASTNSKKWVCIGEDLYEKSSWIASMSLGEDGILTINFATSQWSRTYLGFRKL